MTTDEPTPSPSARPRTLQDDLLADLRSAAPAPAARPAEVTEPPRAGRSQGTDTDTGTPTVDVRVTPRHWSAPSMRPRDTGTGFVLTAGPLRVTVTGFGS